MGQSVDSWVLTRLRTTFWNRWRGSDECGSCCSLPTAPWALCARSAEGGGGHAQWCNGHAIFRRHIHQGTIGIHKVEGVDPFPKAFPKAAGPSCCEMQELRGMFVKALVVHCFSHCFADFQRKCPGCLGSSCAEVAQVLSVRPEATRWKRISASLSESHFGILEPRQFQRSIAMSSGRQRLMSTHHCPPCCSWTCLDGSDFEAARLCSPSPLGPHPTGSQYFAASSAESLQIFANALNRS